MHTYVADSQTLATCGAMRVSATGVPAAGCWRTQASTATSSRRSRSLGSAFSGRRLDEQLSRILSDCYCLLLVSRRRYAPLFLRVQHLLEVCVSPPPRSYGDLRPHARTRTCTCTSASRVCRAALLIHLACAMARAVYVRNHFGRTSRMTRDRTTSQMRCRPSWTSLRR
jgi:hypothetical protein